MNFSSDDPANLLEIEVLERLMRPLMASIETGNRTKIQEYFRL